MYICESRALSQLRSWLHEHLRLVFTTSGTTWPGWPGRTRGAKAAFTSATWKNTCALPVPVSSELTEGRCISETALTSLEKKKVVRDHGSPGSSLAVVYLAIGRPLFRRALPSFGHGLDPG